MRHALSRHPAGLRPARLALLGALGAALILAACTGDRATSESPAASGRTPARSAPPVDMNGRWTLGSSAGGQCGMNFAAAAGAAEGAIRPEGGCPDKFFTSRKWTFEDGALMILNHNAEPLAQLRMAAPGRFDGQAGGAQISLTR